MALATGTHLEERISALMGVINAATASLVAVVAEALSTESWAGAGIRSPEHWVAWRCGVSPHRAATLVAMARRLHELPVTAEAFTAGELSEDQAAVVLTTVDPANDATAASLARSASVSQLRRAVTALAAPDPEPDLDLGDHPDRREVVFGYRRDGRWWCRAVLPPAEGALVQQALTAGRDAVFAAAGTEVAAQVGWCDGLLRLAEAGMAAVEAETGGHHDVLLHVDVDNASAQLHLGPAVPSSTRRLLGCDATVRAIFERDGRPIALGRRQRTIPLPVRRLIEHRDRGCRVPGCNQTRWLHIHHLVHWEDGGPTDPSNLVALCPFHHRMHHHGRLGISGDPERSDGLCFFDADGAPIGPAPPPPLAPSRAPAEAARELGLPTPSYIGPEGARLESWWLTWN